MIEYIKGETNEVVVTLQERVTIDNPFFLLYLTNKSTDVIDAKVFLTDLSTEANRFNLFSVNLSLSTNDYVYDFFVLADLFYKNKFSNPGIP